MILNAVPKLKVKHDTKECILNYLSKLMADVESGDVDSVLFISRLPNGYWNWNISGEALHVEMIGRMEIVKAEIANRIINKE